MYFNESISLYCERSKEHPGGERIKGVCPILKKAHVDALKSYRKNVLGTSILEHNLSSETLLLGINFETMLTLSPTALGLIGPRVFKG
jgi:hypothetical protein